MKNMMKIGLLVAVLAGMTSAQAQMVGLDFRTAIAGWTAVEATSFTNGVATFSNLTDTNGASTLINVTLFNTNGTSISGSFVNAPTNSTIPPELAGMAGYLSDPGELIVTFSNLTPGASCEVGVIGSITAAAGAPKTQFVTLIGTTTSNFNQTVSSALTLFVNEQQGSSSIALSNAMKTVTADASGVVVVRVKEGTVATANWRVMGIALTQAASPAPQPSTMFIVK